MDVDPTQCMRRQARSQRLYIREPPEENPDERTSEDIRRIVKSEIDPRQTDEKRHIDGYNRAQLARDEPQPGACREEGHCVIAREGTPPSQGLLGGAIWQYKAEVRGV